MTNNHEDPKRFLNDVGFRTVLDIWLKSSKDQFATELSEIGLCTTVKHRIDTGTARPITCRSRRYSTQDMAIISAEIKKLLDNNLIVESAAEWASPLLLVPRPDNSKRACVDFRAFNFVTKKDVYPLPLIDDIFDSLTGSTVYSSLDLFSGFWQIAVAEENIEKTTFTCPNRIQSYAIWIV